MPRGFRTFFTTPTFVFCLPLLLLASACGETPRDESAAVESPLEFLNHSDSAKYVGMQVCRGCHGEIYNTFIRTGMGQSIARASKKKSAGDFSRSHIYDRFSDFHYGAFWKGDSMYIREYRIAPGSKKDTLFARTEQVNYIIGSGQHTNSHIRNFNGYLHQMPMTYYTQEGKWDLPPGFEGGENTRFSRKIGIECMSCHNAYPDFVAGSENKFSRVPEGIDCERCHGPGSVHVAARSSGAPVDTSKEIDRTIVNPAKLAIERQFDVCQRCHLQGNAVLKNGKSFYDFRPGMKLSDFMAVFMPRYEGADEEFIMASHAERLKLSPCFIQSAKKAEGKSSLRPYKGAMTCVTCHNPHVSVKETGTDVFNGACRNCHPVASVSVTTAHGKSGKWENCLSCHMPRSGSTDIPHVTVHDHYIRKPVTASKQKAIRKFLGLYAVNEKHPDPLTRANAYLSQFERFKRDAVFLDSAATLLARIESNEESLHANIQLLFLRDDYAGMARLAERFDPVRLRNSVLVNRTLDNRDAWTCYRLGEAYSQLRRASEAVAWYHSAVELAPLNPEFRNKLGAALSSSGASADAQKEFEFLVREHPYFVSGYSNLGYLRLVQGQPSEAIRLFRIGLALDPDNVPLLLNVASYNLFVGNESEAREVLSRALLKDPHNAKAKQALESIRKPM